MYQKPKLLARIMSYETFTHDVIECQHFPECPQLLVPGSGTCTGRLLEVFATARLHASWHQCDDGAAAFITKLR